MQYISCKLQCQIKVQAERLNGVEKELEVAIQATKHWQMQCETLQEMQQQLTRQLIDSEAVAKTQQNQLAQWQAEIEELKSQNKLLHHEKWMLAQERAQMAGQMQQMQKMTA